ncbi:MAG: PEP/pyruvate-binding domain-containing protein [bacterium]
MSSPPIPSGALRINLQRTALPVRIPERQNLLLEIVAAKVGIRRQTEALLQEVNHPFANWDELVETLRGRALGDFYYYNCHDRGAEALAILADLFFECLEKCQNKARRMRAFATLLDFLELLLLESGAAAARNRPVLEQAAARLEQWLEQEPLFAARSTSWFKKTIRKASLSADAPLGPLARLYRYALSRNYEIWLSQDDLEQWYLKQRKSLFEGKDYGPLFRTVSHERIEEHLRALNALPAWEAGRGDGDSALTRMLALPDFSDLEQACTGLAHRIGNRSDPGSAVPKIHYLLKLLDIPALEDQHESVLWEVGRSLEQLRGQEESAWVDFLGRIFRVLRQKADRYGSAVLDAVQTIGREVYQSGNPRLIETLIDELILLGFEHPDVKGVNRDWQVVANPLHLKNLRVWLSLIRMRPSRSRKLISALIVNLRLGGLFISDTDLFQKDISQLLAADFESCYSLIKQLARLFPVYFHEIGAEGELREVSTEVDELSGRQDRLIHFLRKQCHVESHNQIVRFVESILHYWMTGEKERLRGFLPQEIYDQIEAGDPFQQEMEPIFRALLDDGRFTPVDLLARSSKSLCEALREVPGASALTLRKAEDLLQLYRLLAKKYTINHHDVLKDLAESNFFASKPLNSLAEALEQANHERAVDLILYLLSVLRDNILSKEPTAALEEIYRKRHIAVGIPSLYGRYKEKRFDSLGLTFRLESLAKVLFEEMAADLNLDYVTQSTLQRVHHVLTLFAEALRLDGIFVETLISNLDLFQHALQSRDFTVDQYLNIFQFIARTVKEITQAQYIAIHESNLRVVIGQIVEQKRALPFTPARDSSAAELLDQACEWFIRDRLATSFAIQSLDNLIGRVLASLAKESQSLDRGSRTLLLSYDPEKCFSTFRPVDSRLDTQIYLGNKGYVLGQLRSFDYPVPPGFIITTEFFRCASALTAYRAAEQDFLRRLRDQVRALEHKCGQGLGDSRRPLLLSVRSGATISMPGVMNTFLNIGINETITESLARRPRFEWAAWDDYRRFLQCWGMSFGIPRDRFDEIILEMKRIYSARYKRELAPEQMRELAHAYRKLLERTGVELPSDPWEQLQIAISQVVGSWNSDNARLYRQTMKIAEEWGTAVVVQQMVFGNLDSESGTGVVFTRNPKRTESAVSLFGDYTVCAQGEDVVAGLVETFPVSELQRATENPRADISLEEEFPAIYGRLKEIAEDLVYKRGFNHQEIEFTFEGPEPESFYILQSRDIAPSEGETLQCFVPTQELKASLLGTGIGVGGGSLCGIAVHRAEEIGAFRRRHPGIPLILLRPDTVPDDIHMILRVDGILTARGGSTSHAAVTAYRLGKTCVVGCRQLQVNEKASRSVIGEHVLESGHWLAIDGHGGFIYKGRHKTTPARVRS